MKNTSIERRAEVYGWSVRYSVFSEYNEFDKSGAPTEISLARRLSDFDTESEATEYAARYTAEYQSEKRHSYDGHSWTLRYYVMKLFYGKDGKFKGMANL